MPIRFVCPRCQAPNSWPKATAGTTVACQHCSKRIAIPKNVTKGVESTADFAQIDEGSAAGPPSEPATPDSPAAPIQMQLASMPYSLPSGASIRNIFWMVLLAWVALCAFLYVRGHGDANSASQQVAVSADTVVMLLGGYVFVRAIEKLTKG